MKRKFHLRRLIALFSLLTLLSSLFSCQGLSNVTTEPSGSGFTPADGKTLTVSFLDVGQGDSIFIELPDSRTMLIDASESSYASAIETYIRSRGYTKIDYMVGTHPHSDHIGGLQSIVNAFDIGEIWMPDAESTSYTYEKLLTAIADKELKIHTAKAGKTILEEANLKIALLAPCGSDYSSLNNYSAVIRLTYGQTAFLFTGDAETQSETEMLQSGAELSADVLKLGHHGSSTSSSAAFLQAVAPRYGVISCGTGNSYGHPHSETLAAAQKYGITLCRTDIEGTIVFTSNGSSVRRVGENGEPTVPETSPAETQSAATEPKWVLNTSSKKIHRPDCASVASMSDRNKDYSSESVAALIEQGYSPCGSCNPTD